MNVSRDLFIPGQRISNIIVIPILFLFSFLFYFRTLNFNFAGDDWGIIYEKKSVFDNPEFVKNILLFPAIKHGLKSALYTYFSLTAEVSYRPLNTLSYFLDYKIWGMSPFGFHATNVLFHSGNVLLLYLFGSAISGSQLFGFLSAFLFAIHPFTAEPVAVVSFREDLMALFFILLSCLFILGFIKIQRNSIIYLGLSLFFYISAILCKENSVVAFAIYFYLITKERRKFNAIKGAIWFLGSGGLIGLSFIWIRFKYNPPTALNPLISNFKDAVYTLGYVFGKYICYLFVPWRFPLYFPWQFNPLSHLNMEGWFYLSISAIAFIAGVYILLNKRISCEIRFGLIWMIVFFLPLAFIKYLPSSLAARYLYIPGAGGVMIASSIFVQGLRIRRMRLATIVMFACYSLYLGVVARREMNRWQNDVVFYETQKKEFPNSWMVHKKYGDFLLSLNYLVLALKEYTNAYLINPYNSEILEKLASSLFALKQYDKAEKFYFKVLEIKPDSIIALKGLGIIYGLRTAKEQALLYLNKALMLAPGDRDLLENIQKVKRGEKNFKLYKLYIK